MLKVRLEKASNKPKKIVRFGLFGFFDGWGFFCLLKKNKSRFLFIIKDLLRSASVLLHCYWYSANKCSWGIWVWCRQNASYSTNDGCCCTIPCRGSLHALCFYEKVKTQHLWAEANACNSVSHKQPEHSETNLLLLFTLHLWLCTRQFFMGCFTPFQISQHCTMTSELFAYSLWLDLC